MSKNITIEAIEQSGYKVYAGTEEFPEGRVWTGPREWVTGKSNAMVKHNGKFLKLLKHNAGYLMVILSINKKRNSFLVHRLIAMKYFNIKPEQEVDHRNCNRADNKLCNLRVVTSQQNKFNQLRRNKGTSKYKGVSFFKRDGKWAASIKYNGKKIHLGLFDSEIDAAKTYDNEAIKLFGEYMNLNFTEKGEV